MEKETFAQRFARLRKEKGFTQESIAQKLGVSAQAVSKWETGSSMPDISLLVSISEALGITIDELLGKEKEEVEIIANPTPDDIDKKMLRIKIISVDGDVVKVNLPMALVRVISESGEKVDISGSKALQGIDWKSIIALVDKGVIGDLVSIQSSEGDIVSICIQ
jgi:transcriptional regulator with XRE-family HTH domain